MIIMLFPGPILLGILFLAIGLWKRERWFRIFGDGLLAVGLIILVYQVYLVHEGWTDGGRPYTYYGLSLDGLADYVSFIGFSLAAGLLAGDGLVQMVRKKSSSS